MDDFSRTQEFRGGAVGELARAEVVGDIFWSQDLDVIFRIYLNEKPNKKIMLWGSER